MTTTSVSSDPRPLAASEGPDLGPAAVLLLGFSAAAAREIDTADGIDAAVFVARSVGEAHELLAEHEVAVFCLGAELVGTDARQVLEQVHEGHPRHQGCNVVLAAGPDLDVFQELVSEDRLYYLTQKPPPRADVVHILQSGVEHYHARRSEGAEPDDDDAFTTHRVLKLAEGLAREATLDHAVMGTVEAVTDLAEADRAAVLLYDPATETLWNRGLGTGEERRESAAAGLVSFVVRTRAAVRLEHVGSDPRYDPEADNEDGAPDERFLAVAVTDAASGGRAWAVLVALRGAAKPPFSEADQDRLRLLAEQIAPVYGRFLLQAELEERAVRRHGVWGSQTSQIFREEALEHHIRGMEDRGHVLEIAPGWTAWAYRLLLLLVVVALVFSVVGTINEYASGVAVVRLEGQTDVTARLSGTVVSVEVVPGRRVEEGDLLARLYGAREEAELERARQEFEIGLANRLRNPADPSAGQALVALRFQRNLARKQLEERSVRAPRAGIVGDVWIRAGHVLSPGDVILSLVGGEQNRSIVALLPGHSLPLIEPGMDLRFELQGYSYAYQHLKVESVGEEVVGPAEVRRFLGPGSGAAVQLTGPVVYVTARLPSPTFEVDGQTYAYADGIVGTAEVKVRSEKILVALIPGLRALRNRDDG